MGTELLSDLEGVGSIRRATSIPLSVSSVARVKYISVDSRGLLLLSLRRSWWRLRCNSHTARKERLVSDRRGARCQLQGVAKSRS